MEARSQFDRMSRVTNPTHQTNLDKLGVVSKHCGMVMLLKTFMFDFSSYPQSGWTGTRKHSSSETRMIKSVVLSLRSSISDASHV